MEIDCVLHATRPSVTLWFIPYSQLVVGDSFISSQIDTFEIADYQAVVTSVVVYIFGLRHKTERFSLFFSF